MSIQHIALDEGVPHLLAGLLRSEGYNADSAKELGRLGLTDPQDLLRAAENGQTLATYDSKDFRALHEAWVTWRRRWEAEAARSLGVPLELSRHGGVLIVPHRPNRELADILRALIDTIDAIEDRLFAWDRDRGWHEIIR